MRLFAVIRRSPVAFPLAALAALALALVSEASYQQAVDTLDALNAAQAARLEIQGLAQGILDAEASQRGYLLTGRKEYLQPYDKALRQIDESLKSLDRRYAVDPKSAPQLGQLHDLTEAKREELAQAIRLHDAGSVQGATELVLSDVGKRKMEAIGVLGTELLARETGKVAQGRVELYRTLLFSRIGVPALSALGLLVLYLALRQDTVIEAHDRELKRVAQAERDRLEVEVKLRTAQLTELTHHLQTAREDERNRLARNLHDELGALLTSAKLDAARIKSRLAGTAPEAQERLSHLVETLNASIALGRSIIEDLRPSTLANLGLVPTLEILLREFADHSGTKVHAELHAVQLDHATELVVYRLVQEAITNLSKYARASQVWVSLGPREGRVEVSVRDDGVGFDANTPPRSAFGLAGMRFRIEAAGGSMTLVAAPEQGTQIQVSLPQSA